MPRDAYPNFAELAAGERAISSAYRIIACLRPSPVAVIAPHGGGIEPGTSELVRAIAGSDFSLYCFEGCKTTDNKKLHITSTHFDEPACLALLAGSRIVVALHGCDDQAEFVHVGGKDQVLAARLCDTLVAAGIPAQHDLTRNHPGQRRANICNRGQSGRGCQLEISLGLRRTLFRGLACAERKHHAPRFDVFVSAVRAAVSEYLCAVAAPGAQP